MTTLPALAGLCVLLSCISFLAFFIPGRHRKYAAIAGWAFIILFLYAEIPDYIAHNNLMYPIIAILAIPFFYVTARRLLREDPVVLRLSLAAAVAFLIFAPFAYFPPLGNWLISVVTGQIVWLLNAMGYQAIRLDWNMIYRNGFRIEIILACTGLQSMAIMLGVVAGVPTTLRQKVEAFLLVVPTIYILNLFRNVFVIIAYTDQWFPYLPEIASNGEYGYESFFWAHNVLAELGALLALVIIAYGLFTLIPDLAVWATNLVGVYRQDLEELWRKGTGKAGR
ncbi:MAG: archaeosortase A [Methanomicrobiales archaeon]|nr:archaeosortase A [Methanomicrobiales archaeon]